MNMMAVIDMVEDCANAIDDDGDGLIDLQDPDCKCEVLEPVSLIPNPSFENKICCPFGRSQLSCAEEWIQASSATTDYLHTCEWMGWEEFPPPQPFPDGNAIVGFRDGRIPRNGDNPERDWKEYAGACLLNPMQDGIEYQFEFFIGFVNTVSSPSLKVTLFGTPDCEYLPFGLNNESLGCPTNGPDWIELGSVYANSIPNSWQKLAITVKPDTAIHAIALGPPCAHTQASVNTYYFLDNLVVDELSAFEFFISGTTHPCDPNYLLSVPDNEDITYQWYKNGVALLQEQEATLSKMYGEGDYQVRIENDRLCMVSKIYKHIIPSFSSNLQEILCAGETISFGSQSVSTDGIYTENFITENGCDSLVTMNVVLQGDRIDTVKAKIFNGSSYLLEDIRYQQAGEYLVTLTSKAGCDSLIFLDIEYFKIFIPNIFSPNGDGNNDVFEIYSSENIIVQNLRIFNRWGSEIFNHSGIRDEFIVWDGTQAGSPVETGVYVYIIDLLNKDGSIHQERGSLTLIR